MFAHGEAGTQSAVIHSFVSTHRPEKSAWDCGSTVNLKAIKTGSRVREGSRKLRVGRESVW